MGNRKPNWGAGLQSLGGSLRQYAMMQRQDAMREEERAYEEKLWNDRYATQQQGREEWAAGAGQRELDALDVTDPRVGGSFMGIDLGDYNIRQSGMADLMKSERDHAQRMELAGGRAQAAADKEANKPPKPVSDSMAMGSVITDAVKKMYPNRESGADRLYGELVQTINLDTGDYYPHGQGTANLAAQLAQSQSTATPFFGDSDSKGQYPYTYQEDVGGGQMYDPSYYEYDDGVRRMWGDTDPSINMREGLTGRDLSYAEATPPQDLAVFFNERILPALLNGTVTDTKIHQWAKEKGVSKKAIVALVNGANKREINTAPPPEDDGYVYDVDDMDALEGGR